MSEMLISRHVTRDRASKRMTREIEKLKVSGQSSGWQRRKFMVRSTGKLLLRWKVVEL